MIQNYVEKIVETINYFGLLAIFDNIFYPLLSHSLCYGVGSKNTLLIHLIYKYIIIYLIIATNQKTNL